MFDWFKGKDNEPSNVVPFPVNNGAPPPTPIPTVPTYPQTNVHFGITDDNRVEMMVGGCKLWLTRGGCQNIIDQIEFYMKRLEE